MMNQVLLGHTEAGIYVKMERSNGWSGTADG